MYSIADQRNMAVNSCQITHTLRQKWPEAVRSLTELSDRFFSPGPHPIEFIRDELRARKILSSIELTEAPNGRTVRVAGIVIIR